LSFVFIGPRAGSGGFGGGGDGAAVAEHKACKATKQQGENPPKMFRHGVFLSCGVSSVEAQNPPWLLLPRGLSAISAG
jgi:hypothetical protein